MNLKKEIKIGTVTIGGNHPIAIQSMTNTKTKNIEATVKQIQELEDAGCEMVRMAVFDKEDAYAIADIKKQVHIPLVADIHFDYKLAIDAAEAGISKLRINPGNIGGDDRVRAVAKTCARLGVPVRVGVNGGSLAKKIAEKYGAPTAEALAESALESIRLLERFDFDDLVVSVKSSDVRMMIEANRILARECPYPLHLGVTEAGPRRTGLVKGAIGIGALLADGIGDTIRVSLSDDVTEEVEAGKSILRALGLSGGINLISCPTCGRCRTDLIARARSLEQKLAAVKTDRVVNVALMGCAVNGPGEAAGADLGCACGDGDALLFVGGKTVGRIAEDEIEETLLTEVKKWLANQAESK